MWSRFGAAETEQLIYVQTNNEGSIEMPGVGALVKTVLNTDIRHVAREIPSRLQF